MGFVVSGRLYSLLGITHLAFKITVIVYRILADFIGVFMYKKNIYS